MIEFFNLKEYNSRFEDEFKDSYSKFLDSGWYILGENLKMFERNYAKYCNVKHCVGVANGLDALNLIFKSYIELGKLKPNDEVIVPANTYIATILSVIQSGLKPVFVEPDEKSLNISIEEATKAITDRTKAILAVHLYGQLANMDGINELSKEYGLLVVEDAAQAHGAVDAKGNKAGSLSNAAAFSFYPSKNLGALGDGGAITTNDEELMTVLRKMRNYGTSSKYVNDIIGYNSRLDELQSVFLNIKLKSLDDDNLKRMQIAKQYIEEIKSDKIELPHWSKQNDHVFHQFVIRVKNRDEFLAYMQLHKVGTLIHYPIPPHKQKALSDYKHLQLPITEKIHEEVVSIPISPLMPQEHIDTVIKILNAY
jgi:dTDP-4-amino-4,6-dideoxygalactose transaminase